MKTKIPTPDKFTLYLSGTIETGYRITRKLYNGQVIEKFGVSLLKKYPKIYVVLSEEKIVYVGYTSDSIANRIRYGLNPANKSIVNASKTNTHGYEGYKWRVLKYVELYVFVFSDFEISPAEEVKLMFENIEAEIVYQIKCRGEWPKYQSEIHFYADIEHGKNKTKPAKCFDLFGMSESEIAKNMLECI